MFRHSLPHLHSTLIQTSSRNISRRTIASLPTRNPLLHTQHRPRILPLGNGHDPRHSLTPLFVAGFHSTHRRQGLPIIPLLAILKVSLFHSYIPNIALSPPVQSLFLTGLYSSRSSTHRRPYCLHFHPTPHPQKLQVKKDFAEGRTCGEE